VIPGLLTEAWCNVGSTLLVSVGTAIAKKSGNSVLARTLTGCVVADFTRWTDRMALAGWKEQMQKQLKDTHWDAVTDTDTFRQIQLYLLLQLQLQLHRVESLIELAALQSHFFFFLNWKCIREINMALWPWNLLEFLL